MCMWLPWKCLSSNMASKSKEKGSFLCKENQSRTWLIVITLIPKLSFFPDYTCLLLPVNVEAESACCAFP